MRKKKLSTKITSGLLALVMVFLMIPFSAITISANELDSTIEKYRLYAINGISNQILFDYVADSFDTDAVEGSFQKSQTQKNLSNVNKGLRIASSGFKLIGSVADIFDKTQLAGSIIGAVSDAFAFGEEITGAFIEDDSNEQLMDQLNAMSVQISELSDQIDAFAEANRSDIAQMVQSINDESDLKDYKSTLQEFANDITGNDRFGEYQSYYSWQKELYKRMNAVILAEQKLENGEELSMPIAYYYDRLYLVAKESDELYAYLTTTAFGTVTLPEVAYRYYLLNNVVNGKSLTYQEKTELCIELSQDWYATYAMSQTCLEMCYIYQLKTIMDDTLIVPPYDATTSKKSEITGTSVIYEYDTICNYLVNPMKNITTIKDGLAQYYARILCMDESYIYEPSIYSEDRYNGEKNLYTVRYEEIVENGQYRCGEAKNPETAIEYYSRLNNRVSKGDTLYMNMFPEMFLNILDASKVSFISSKEDLAKVDKAGVVNVVGETGGSFRISMLYNNTVVYYMDFEIIDRLYSGGMGTETCPFLISDFNDLVTLAKNENGHCNVKNIHFKLTNDIDGGGAVFSGIPSFSGTFDGNKHRIYNFKISTSGEITGFFKFINSGGTVQNLIIGNYEKAYTDYENYSAYIVGDGLVRNDIPQVGGLCGFNQGNIKDCSIESIYIRANGADVNGFCGGIAGINFENGTIEVCSVSKSMICASGFKSSNSGSIAGANWATIQDCVSYSNSVVAKGQKYAYSGGIVGYLHTAPATILRCFEKWSSLQPNKISIGGQALSLGIIGAESAGGYVGSECAIDSLGPWVIDSQTGLPIRSSNEPEYVPPIQATQDQHQDITLYIRGETHFKYTDGSIDSNTQETIEFLYELSSYRIDTSVVGSTDVIYLEPISETSMYQKSLIPIEVIAEEATELCVYTLPQKQTYAIDTAAVDLSGLQLVVLYNNGDVRFLEEQDYTMVPMNFDTIGETNITFEYGILSAKVPVTVVSCLHENTVNKPQLNPTCGTDGYEAGTYCEDCYGYINGGAVISKTNEHDWSNWSNHDNTTHFRTCVCGENEYQDHTWDDGTVTKEPNYTEHGEKTYSCTVCNRTKVEMIPVPTPQDAPTILIDSKPIVVGKTVTVNITLKNNPGIASMNLLLSYDTSVLTLTDVTFNSEMGGMSQQPQTMTSPVNLNWFNGTANTYGDLVFVTLVFDVSGAATGGETTKLSVAYDKENVYDITETNIDFYVDGGELSIVDYTPGDINGDGEVNNKDVTRLFQYLSGWEVEVNEAALNVNGDEAVNNKDLTRLFQYMSGWDVELY